MAWKSQSGTIQINTESGQLRILVEGQEASIPLNSFFSKGLIIGDSTIATYSCGTQDIGSAILSNADIDAGNTIYNQAVPGNTILQQQTIFLADANKNTYDWIFVQIGLNDLDPSETVSVAMARYQNLIDNINSNKKATAKVFVGAMTPCRQRLIDVYGSTNGVLAYNKWLAMNEAIMGGGAYKVVGVDYRVDNHLYYLNDGSGNIRAEYNCGDHIHENNAARAIIASIWRDQLNLAGFLTAKLPTSIIRKETPNNEPYTVVSRNVTGGASFGAINATSAAISGVVNIIEGRINAVAYNANMEAAMTVYNALRQAALTVINDNNIKGGLISSGSNFNVPLFRDKVALYSSKSLLILCDGLEADGGTSKIELRTKGYDNPVIALTLDNESTAIFGGKIQASNLPICADEAEAISAGLLSGNIYRTATGELRIKL